MNNVPTTPISTISSTALATVFGTTEHRSITQDFFSTNYQKTVATTQDIQLPSSHLSADENNTQSKATINFYCLIVHT